MPLLFEYDATMCDSDLDGQMLLLMEKQLYSEILKMPSYFRLIAYQTQKAKQQGGENNPLIE